MNESIKSTFIKTGCFPATVVEDGQTKRVFSWENNNWRDRWKRIQTTPTIAEQLIDETEMNDVEVSDD